MFSETYTKFYLFMVVAMVVGFVGMEFITTEAQMGGFSGMVTHDVSTESLTGNGTPGSNILFLLIGVLAGAVIVGTAVFIYSVEKKRMF